MTNTFTVTSWDENIVSGPETGPRFAYAHTQNRYTGTIEATSVCDYLLHYLGDAHDGTGIPAHGVEHITGSVDGHHGGFLVQHTVEYGANGISGKFTVLPGSGTEDLASISGTGSYAVDMAAERVPYTFDYRL